MKLKLDESLYEKIKGDEITDLELRVKFAPSYTMIDSESGIKKLKTPFKLVFVKLPNGKIKVSVVTEKFKPIRTEDFLKETGLDKVTNWSRFEEDLLMVKGELNGVDVFVENSYAGNSALKVSIGKKYPIAKLSRVIHYGNDSVNINVKQLEKEVEVFSAFLESKINLKSLKEALSEIVKFDKKEQKEVPVGLILYEKLKKELSAKGAVKDEKTADAASVSVIEVIKAIDSLYKERKKGDGLTKAVKKKLMDVLSEHYEAWKEIIKKDPSIRQKLKISL